MKTVSLVVVLAMGFCLVGCENAELVTCQQEKQTLQAQADTLQGQLDKANATIAKKDAEIEKMKTDNVKMQTEVMEKFSIMMKNQAAKDKELKNKNEDLKAQNRIQQDRIAELEVENENLKGLHENALQSLKAAQELIEKMNEEQKKTAP